MESDTLEAWDLQDLSALLTLKKITPLRYQNRFGIANSHGTAFGGQLLGQALTAAAMTVPREREVTAIQLLFLQSAVPELPIDFEVTSLQDGKRFASRRVCGTQAGGRMVFDAHVTFALPLSAPRHAAASRAADIDPQTLPTVDELPQEWADVLDRVMGYSLRMPPLDLRFVDPPEGLRLEQPTPGVCFWIKTSESLLDTPHLHAAAFAYLSDAWINFSAVGGHFHALADTGQKLYVASLNHAVWFHRPLRADEWLHFDVQSPSAENGRGLSIARVHDRHGTFVASVTQENLMTVPA